MKGFSTAIGSYVLHPIEHSYKSPSRIGENQLFIFEDAIVAVVLNSPIAIAD